MTQQQAEEMTIRLGCLRCRSHILRRYGYSYDYQGNRCSEMECVDCGMIARSNYYPIPKENQP